MTRIRLTAAGDALIAAAEQWQRAAFADGTAEWADEDRVRFAETCNGWPRKSARERPVVRGVSARRARSSRRGTAAGSARAS